VDPVLLEEQLHSRIPLSRQLGARVAEAGMDLVRLTAPLELNLNHRDTAFGGSLSSLAILAAWAWLYLASSSEGFHGRIVIQHGAMDYIAPVAGDFEAVCRRPGTAEWNEFRETLKRRKRARIELRAAIHSGGRVAATFAGRYVALDG